MNWAGVVHAPLECLEDVLLGLQDLALGVGRVSAVKEVLRRGRDDLFDLGSDEHARDPDELEFGEGDNARGEEAVNDVDREEKGLWEKTEAHVDLDEPVSKDAAHLPCEVLLVVHVIRVRHRRSLERSRVRKRT